MSSYYPPAVVSSTKAVKGRTFFGTNSVENGRNPLRKRSAAKVGPLFGMVGV